MKIKMQLLSDTIFGNGVSIPGGEDMSVLCDENGFPYYKGSTFKGIFREEIERYLFWTEKKEIDIDDLLGKEGDDTITNSKKLVFSDFVLSEGVKKAILKEVGENKEKVCDSLTNLRTFTSIDEDTYIAKEGSLRMARCVNKGLIFYSEIMCDESNVKLCEDIENVLKSIKWLGTMRNRGFGQVIITKEGN